MSSKLKLKKEKQNRQSLALKCAYVWALWAAVDNWAGWTEASLTCLEHVSYYLSSSGTMKSKLKTELQQLIDINQVTKD